MCSEIFLNMLPVSFSIGTSRRNKKQLRLSFTGKANNFSINANSSFCYYLAASDCYDFHQNRLKFLQNHFQKLPFGSYKGAQTRENDDRAKQPADNRDVAQKSQENVKDDAR